MKKILSLIALSCLTALAFTSCMDDTDEPNTDNFITTSPVSVGNTNTTIGDIKDKYCASSANAQFVRNSSNFFSKIEEDLVIEGVVAANDISGNLYQTLLLRSIDQTAGTDQSIVFSIKNTCLYPYFPLGQRVKVNLKGLYVGCYSKVPKIGTPYYTSYDNMNLGPMLLQLCATQVELVGKPDPNAPELVPVVPTDDWLRATANRTYKNYPMLATVTGSIVEVQGANKDKAEVGEVTGELEPLPKIFGPEPLHDNGYGIDRHIQLRTNTTKVTLRTSTQNDISFTLIPEDVRSYTGMLTYYDAWQIQLRDLNDIQLPKE